MIHKKIVWEMILCGATATATGIIFKDEAEF
jgi:hypothetical protein